MPCAWARDASCSSPTAKRSWARRGHLRPHPPKKRGWATTWAAAATLTSTCCAPRCRRWPKREHLERFAPQHFDYVVIDEFHHAAAAPTGGCSAHFAPAFLLGLTATPDRTDQSDILSLCDDNLVYSCHLFEGIQAGLLAPFHYYGIQDESVDYREVPWRNGRFDPEQLSNKLATWPARATRCASGAARPSSARWPSACRRATPTTWPSSSQRAGVAAAAVYAARPRPRAGAGAAARRHAAGGLLGRPVQRGRRPAQHRHGDDAAAHRVEDPVPAATGPRPAAQRRQAAPGGAGLHRQPPQLPAEAAGAVRRGRHLPGARRFRAQGESVGWSCRPAATSTTTWRSSTS
jgi:hypothetical protein